MRPLSDREERIASAIGCAVMGALAGWIGFGAWGLGVLAALGAWVGYTEELE